MLVHVAETELMLRDRKMGEYGRAAVASFDLEKFTCGYIFTLFLFLFFLLMEKKIIV